MNGGKNVSPAVDKFFFPVCTEGEKAGRKGCDGEDLKSESPGAHLLLIYCKKVAKESFFNEP